MRILMLGDVVGKPGRKALKRTLLCLRKELRVDAVIVNAENAAGGVGVTPETMRELFSFGADILTSGNHIWKHRSIYNDLEREPRMLRPANYPEGAPGRGMCVHRLPDGRSLAVLNLIGRTFMEGLDCPFKTADRLLAGLPEDIRVRCVDIHAEATSEKKALSWFLDGRVSVVVGTHTHVQTNDPQLLPGGTGYLTDLGMCGVEASVLGMDPDVIIQRFTTRLPAPFRLASGSPLVSGALFDINEQNGLCTSVELVRREVDLLDTE